MPIKGLTDQARATFPILGKLRKGAERSDEDKAKNRPGQDLPHFRFTSERPEVQAAFEDAYEKMPALIHVYLPHAGIEANFACWKEAWAAGGLQHRCDGETCTVWVDGKGEYQQVPKPCPGGCHEVGRLSLIVPELLGAGYVGYVTLETHSLNDILSIQASLQAALEARGDNPQGLKGILWTVRRQAVKISTPAGNGKRARREKWLIRLEPCADWVQLKQAEARAIAMLPAAGVTVKTKVAMPGRPTEVEAEEGEFEEAEPSESQPVASAAVSTKAAQSAPVEVPPKGSQPQSTSAGRASQQGKSGDQPLQAITGHPLQSITQKEWTSFKAACAELGVDQEGVREILGVESIMSGWCGKGNTLAEALAKVKAAVFAPPKGEVKT